MNNTKIFINILGVNYIKKTITLDKGYFSTQYVHFYLNSVDNSLTIKQTFQKETKDLISKNDVIISTADFGKYSIVTTGGIIIGDNLPEKITSLATKKRDSRRTKLDYLFPEHGYSQSHFELYEKNKETIKSLLDLQFCYWNESNAGIKDYQRLLECLLGITEPLSMTEEYEEKAKQLLKEYLK